jgi:hypothetical protein
MWQPVVPVRRLRGTGSGALDVSIYCVVVFFVTQEIS